MATTTTTDSKSDLIRKEETDVSEDKTLVRLAKEYTEAIEAEIRASSEVNKAEVAFRRLLETSGFRWTQDQLYRDAKLIIEGSLP